jgi:hypothetical protein
MGEGGAEEGSRQSAGGEAVKTLVYLSLTIAAALALIAGIVFGLGDATTFVPPPEAVVQGFMRELETKRYERAKSYLSKERRAKVSSETLKELTERLKQNTGKIMEVRGEKGWIQGDRAEASVWLKTELLGWHSLKFALSREDGVWLISDLHSLEVPALDIKSEQLKFNDNHKGG